MLDPREGVAPDGTIETGVGRERVPAAYEALIVELIEEFAAVTVPTAELFVYGSVAAGTAQPGRSDVDILAVDYPPEWVTVVADRLSSRYAQLCRAVEIGAMSSAELCDTGDAAYGDRVFLRHYCVPLAGPNLLTPRMPFTADVRAARGFNGDIARCLERWRAQPASARKVARKTLVAAAGIVSVRTRGWTTDRATAVKSWDLIDATESEAMNQLLGWVDGVDDQRAHDVDAALAEDGIVASVVRRFTCEIGLWTA